MLGDAGEHYAIAKLSFAGACCSKMPDNWPAYDIFLQKGDQSFCISVKTRSETASFGSSSYFRFSSIDQCQWLICIVKRANGEIDGWVIPTTIAATQFKLVKTSPGEKLIPEYKTTFSQLSSKLKRFKENWDLCVTN